MNAPDEIREQTLRALRGGSAHLDVIEALRDVPPEARGRKAPGLPHTPWQLLEHLRIAQEDILEFARNPEHESPKFPSGYWPESESPPDDSAWETSLERFRSDLEALQEVVANRAVDLTEPLPHLDGPTWFREVMLVVSHNAYHVGQVVLTRRALGAWES
ncbi:MAG: DinB family protein [Vicinamibacteria bacterium]